MTEQTFIGRGTVYLAELTSGTPTGLYPVGNCSKLALAISDESKELVDYTSASGGVYASVYRIKDVELSATLHDFNTRNLAMALRADITETTSASVTDEAHTAYLGALVPFTFLPDSAQTITVKNNAGDTTYVANTDYVVKGNGILVLDTGSIADASTIKVSYTKDAAYVVQALTQAGKSYKVVFDGLNEAKSGEVVSVEIYNIKFSPLSSLDFISDDFNSLEVKGKVLADTSIVTAGASQYFRISKTKL